jgi:hypothetical protein
MTLVRGVSIFAFVLALWCSAATMSRSDASLPEPFAFATRSSILEAAVGQMSSADRRAFPPIRSVKTSLESLRYWNVNGRRYAIAVVCFEDAHGSGYSGVSVIRARRSRLVSDGLGWLGYCGPETEDKVIGFDFSSYLSGVGGQAFAVRRTESGANQEAEFITLFELRDEHVRSVIWSLPVFGRSLSGPRDGFITALHRSTTVPMGDIQLQTTELTCGFGPIAHCHRSRDRTIQTQTLRFDGDRYALVPGSVPVSVPLRYDAKDVMLLAHAGVPARVPTRIPGSWLGLQPSVTPFDPKYESSGYSIGIGVGKDCGGTTSCTAANEYVMRGALLRCNPLAPRNGRGGYYDTCGRRAVRLLDGTIAWFESHPCGANCEGSSTLAFSARGAIYELSGKATPLDELLVLANSLEPPQRAPRIEP